MIWFRMVYLHFQQELDQKMDSNWLNILRYDQISDQLSMEPI